MAQVIRMCAGCRQRAAREELVRLVWSDGAVVVDERCRLPGRGVYLHPGCVAAVLRNRGVGRGLRREVDARQLRDLLDRLAG
ncbi:MAG: YlxR family protein [Propionicimonas sp.]|uniref:YlxR family protein n=1 Tax=Propionicimonas sp. TaxID=1955623 RepID=UPI002B20AA97|nr:YlxR family protein [Propionicimonas sp.]MEA4944348.1 YlxR family protein [Propionicimonas sp.]MEA5118890.1 YlxR family protein [Propionicimonas sp.]